MSYYIDEDGTIRDDSVSASASRPIPATQAPRIPARHLPQVTALPSTPSIGFRLASAARVAVIIAVIVVALLLVFNGQNIIAAVFDFIAGSLEFHI